MARADTASASLRPDSIKGLAKSIAKPAYRRLLTAEPLLRRAVPVLIVAFLLTICIGAVCRSWISAVRPSFDARRHRGAGRRTRDGLDRPGREMPNGRPHLRPARAHARLGGRRRPRQFWSPTPRARSSPPFPTSAPHDRPLSTSRTVAAPDHVRRRRRHAGNRAGRRRHRVRHGAGTAATRWAWSPD